MPSANSTKEFVAMVESYPKKKQNQNLSSAVKLFESTYLARKLYKVVE